MKKKLPSGDLESMKLGSCHVNDVMDGVLVNQIVRQRLILCGIISYEREDLRKRNLMIVD